jgi:hypothetical protein
MTCYEEAPGGTVWLAVADGYSATSAYCGLVFSSGSFVAVMNQAPVGWTAGFVIIY